MDIYIKFYKMIFKRELLISKEVSIFHLLEIALNMLFCLIIGVIKTRRMRLVFANFSTRFFSVGKIHLGRGVRFGRYCTIDSLGKDGIYIGDCSKIADYSILKVSGSLGDLGSKIHIGKNVGLSEYSYIGGAGGVSIGDSVIAGQYLSLHPENHIFDNPELEIRHQGVSRSGITIGENCWIGSKVTFLDGSEVGKNCVVAAGSVVTKKFPNNVLLAGVPAKIIKPIMEKS